LFAPIRKDWCTIAWKWRSEEEHELIQVDLNKCTGCKKCEVACAFFHTGKVGNHLARIKVLNLYETGIDGPVVCVQCKERYCLSCPEEALSLGPSGQVMVSPTVCSMCGVCEKACPIGAIEIFDDIVYVCDLCGGKPKCVEACTEGALSFVNGDEKGLSLNTVKTRTRKMSPNQKRQFYLKRLGVSLREKWSRMHA
jgi:carbon-monoxide dehydrogenase iron sulfur subunit